MTHVISRSSMRLLLIAASIAAVAAITVRPYISNAQSSTDTLSLASLTATYGSVPSTPDAMNASATTRAFIGENNWRQVYGFPLDWMVKRDPVMDRVAENALHHRFGEPLAPSLPNTPAIADSISWGAVYISVPDAMYSVFLQDRLTEDGTVVAEMTDADRRPELGQAFTFTRYKGLGLTTRADLANIRMRRYRRLGFAARILDEDPTQSESVRSDYNRLIPGAGDIWQPHQYDVLVAIVGTDPLY